MIEACASGEVYRLKELLGITNGKPGVSRIEPYWLPSWEMLHRSIEQKQTGTLELLLITYPKWYRCSVSVLRTATQNPDLHVFKLLHSHFPAMINMHFDHICTALTEACEGGNPLIPNYLIDNGSDLNEGGLPGWGPLHSAVSQKQSSELVKKMVEYGAQITGCTLLAAIRRQQLEILDFLLNRYSYSAHESYLEAAQNTNNIEVIAIVEKREKKLKTGNKRLAEDETMAERRWRGVSRIWQFWNGAS